MAKARNKARKQPAAAAVTMTTAEARSRPDRATASTRSTRCPACTTTICSTRCSRPATGIRTVHTRHEQGAAYMALGAALATGKPQAYAVVPGPGLLNPSAALLTAYVDECAGAGADRRKFPTPTSAAASRPPARDPRPGRHHLAAGRLFGAHPQRRARRRAWSPRRCARWRSGRPGPAALECAIDVWGKRGSGRRRSAPLPRPRRSDRRGRDPQGREAARRRQAPDDRLRRRRAGAPPRK